MAAQGRVGYKVRVHEAAKADGPGERVDSEKTASWSAVWELAKYLWPARNRGLQLRALGAFACIALAKLFGVWVPFFYKDAVDALSVDAPTALPLLAIFSYGAARITSLAFTQLRQVVFERVEQQAIRKASLRVFEHLHRLPLAFHLSRQTGGLGRSIERGTRAMSSLLSVTLFSLLPTLLELVLVVGVLWTFFSGRYALVVGTTVALFATFTVVTTEWRLKFRKTMVEADKAAGTRAVDSLLNFETVKYFNNESYEAERYNGALRTYEDAAVRSQSSLGLLNVGQAAIVATGLTVLMGMAANGILLGTMTLGDFVLVNTYLMQLAQPLNIFGWVYRSVKQSVVDMSQMFALLDEVPEIADRKDALSPKLGTGHIRVEGVSFGYDQQRTILNDVSFEVPPGGTVALVGPSGGGKSTLGRLLFRFWDPIEGKITIDGIDLRDMTQHSLRSQIGIVPQDTVLFNETLAYNLHYAKPGASKSQLLEAVRLAALQDFVSKTPKGLDTVVGERGLKLSGGEKQRVAIARVFIKAPPIVILDEATSALDTETEREIQKNLQAVSQGRTTLVIAHRLSTVVEADEILVLKDGEIQERGTHIELLEQGGVYADMWAVQQRALPQDEAA